MLQKYNFIFELANFTSHSISPPIPPTSPIRLTSPTSPTFYVNIQILKGIFFILEQIFAQNTTYSLIYLSYYFIVIQIFKSINTLFFLLCYGSIFIYVYIRSSSLDYCKSNIYKFKLYVIAYQQNMLPLLFLLLKICLYLRVIFFSRLNPPLARACSSCPIQNSKFKIQNSKFKIQNSKFFSANLQRRMSEG